MDSDYIFVISNTAEANTSVNPPITAL